MTNATPIEALRRHIQAVGQPLRGSDMARLGSLYPEDPVAETSTIVADGVTRLEEVAVVVPGSGATAGIVACYAAIVRPDGAREQRVEPGAVRLGVKLQWDAPPSDDYDGQTHFTRAVFNLRPTLNSALRADGSGNSRRRDHRRVHDYASRHPGVIEKPGESGFSKPTLVKARTQMEYHANVIEAFRTRYPNLAILRTTIAGEGEPEVDDIPNLVNWLKK